MSCPVMKMRNEPIADTITDKSLVYPYHTVFTHLGCVLLRTVVGVTLINPNLTDHTRKVIIMILVMAILLFGIKYIKLIKKDIILWKSYLRMIVAYTSALYFIASKQENLAGMIVIMDALIGLQSRHTASALSCGL